MSSTGGRRSRAARSGTPTAVGFAALVAALLLAACSGDAKPADPADAAEDVAEAGASPDESDRTPPPDPRQAQIADVLRRVDLSFSDPSSYTFTSRATGTFPATVRGEGNLRRAIIQHTSSWRVPVVKGPGRYRFVVNDVTSAYLGAGLPTVRPGGFVPISGEYYDVIEAIHGPGADSLPGWTYGINEVADEMTGIDLDPDGTGDKVAFSLPTRKWLDPGEELPEGIGRTTDYELTFDGEDLVRIEALRDDTIITTRIEHGPYRRIALPAVARQGP